MNNGRKAAARAKNAYRDTSFSNSTRVPELEGTGMYAHFLERERSEVVFRGVNDSKKPFPWPNITILLQ